jgi:alpha/beta superfamily hydrolase
VVQEKTVTFSSGNLKLEGLVYAPEGAAPSTYVVVCHPHPQYGGDMHNNVVMAIVRAAVEGGLGAVAFNFRGVGASEGSFDNGVGEREDVRAALSFAGAMPGVKRVALAGYSFGAGMAASVAADPLAALALVALPPGMVVARDAGIKGYTGPVLLVSGSADKISPASALEDLARALPRKPDLRIVPGADHFWRGRERDLAAILADFIQANLV